MTHPSPFLVASAQMEENDRQFDFDWLVDRLGLRRQRVRAAAGREGLPRRRARVRPALRRRRLRAARPGTCAATSGRRGSGCAGIFRLSTFKDVAVVSGCGVGGGSSATRTRSTAPADAVLRGPAVGATSPTGRRELAPALRRGASGCSASSTYDRRRPGRPAAARVRRATSASATPTPRRASASSSASPGVTRPRPVLRRRGPGPHRLHAVRALHGRLPARRQEHAREELPVARRAPRRRGRRRSARSIDIRPLGAADGSDGYAVTQRALAARWLRPRPRTRHRPRRRRRGRRARHQPAARSAAASAARCRASPTASASSCARTASRSSPSPLPDDSRTTSRKRVAITLARSTPTPTRTSRRSPTATAGDSMSLALHAARRRRHARHAAAASCSAAIAPPPGHVRAGCSWPRGWSRRTIIVLVMQTLDNAIALRADAHALLGGVRLQTEQDPEKPEPDVHPGRQPGGRVARRAHRRHRAELDHGGDRSTSRRPRTSSAARSSAPIPSDGVSTPHQRVFGYENLLVCDGAAVPGERRREPEPHDHRARRARDEPHPAGGRGARRSAAAGDRRRRVVRIRTARLARQPVTG